MTVDLITKQPYPNVGKQLKNKRNAQTIHMKHIELS